MTHSCTAALEMSAMLAGIGPGDEVIMPSFTFSSTANAFALRGAVPVFVDVDGHAEHRPVRAADAITARTSVSSPSTTAASAATWRRSASSGATHGPMLIEDAAQCIGATLDGRPLGAIGDLGRSPSTRRRTSPAARAARC